MKFILEEYFVSFSNFSQISLVSQVLFLKRHNDKINLTNSKIKTNNIAKYENFTWKLCSSSSVSYK